jgi:hypothetical protein
MPGTINPIGIGGIYAVYPRQASAGAPPAILADPGNTNPPFVFEPPSELSGGVPEVWLVATGAGANWGGCQAWISSDGDTYAFLGNIQQGARQGVLTAPLPIGSDPDTSDTLAVDLAMSNGRLYSGTRADADGLVTLCCVDSELMAYETATLTSLDNYDLSYLRRGAYGSRIAAHAAGAPFARFGPTDPSVLKYTYPASYVGRTIYLKLPAFNIYGGAVQSLAQVEPTTFSLLGAGITIPANNPVIAALAAGENQDWGTVGTAVAQKADFGPITLAPGLDIDLGTVP